MGEPESTPARGPRLLGLLPVLLHKDPQEICVIGLGSGVTLGSALTTGAVRRADVVEISPEVVEASAFFDRESGHVLQAPGVRLIVGDGRSHLKLTPRRYDVIVSEPSNPWMAGVAALFTREFFEVARARAWFARGLVAKDFQHPTSEGAQRIADALYAGLVSQ